jgi:hypothetical protein
MNRKPLPTIQADEQLHVPRSGLHPGHVSPDDGEDLPHHRRQPCASDDGNFIHSIRTDHLDVTVHIQQG